MADTNLIKKADLARAREVEFVSLFGENVSKLMEALGVTRKIAKQAGTALKMYKATGTLENGTVPEGDDIPLSKYKTEAVNVGEITLKKWRKATSAEAIVERGYDQAVEMTTDRMLKDVQKGIRTDLFAFLATGTGKATGADFQAALAQAWGQLQVLFEDDANGDKVFYKIPKGSKILAVKFRETGYDTEFVSHFRCNDPFFNELWKRSERTMYVNMRDTYFDCPDRERSQWWGDVVNDIQQSFYALSPSSWDIITKGIYELMNWQRPNGTIFSPIPAGNWNKELPCQMLMSVGWYGFRHQAFYSGDYSFVAPVYDRLHRYLHDVWKINDEGIAQVREGEWGFADWGDHIDMDIITTCWYYLALKAEKEFAEELEKMNDAAQIGGMMEKMEENFNHRFWKGDHYRSANYKDAEPDDRAQALAVLCGFAGKDKYPALLKVFNTSRYASPFLELYVQKALFKMGEGRFALERAKERFGNMMSYKEYTTMFELWTISASVNHGWSSGMIAVFGEELCGIRPTSRGFKTFEICPDMAGLTEVSTQVETRYGFIKVNLKREGNQTTLCLTVPRNTEATVRFGQSRCRLDAGTYRMQVTETAPGYYIYNDIN